MRKNRKSSHEKRRSPAVAVQPTTREDDQPHLNGSYSSLALHPLTPRQHDAINHRRLVAKLVELTDDGSLTKFTRDMLFNRRLKVKASKWETEHMANPTKRSFTRLIIHLQLNIFSSACVGSMDAFLRPSIQFTSYFPSLSDFSFKQGLVNLFMSVGCIVSSQYCAMPMAMIIVY